MGEKRPNPSSVEQYKEDEPRKLFVGGLARRTTAESLKIYFAAFGNIVDSIVMMDQQGESRGFGFVTFDRTESIDAVVQEAVHFVDAKQVDVKRSVAKHLRPPPRQYDRTKKAFLGGLPAEMSEEELKQFFSIYGKVSDITIMYDEKTLKSRGFGFIGFEDENVIDKLLRQQYIQVRNKQVEVKAARPRTQINAYGMPGGDPHSMMIGPTMPHQQGHGPNGPYPYHQQPHYPQHHPQQMGQFYSPSGAYNSGGYPPPPGAYPPTHGGYPPAPGASPYGNFYGAGYGSNMYGYGGGPTPGPMDPPTKRMKGPANGGGGPQQYGPPYGVAPNGGMGGLAGGYPHQYGGATPTPTTAPSAVDQSAAYASYYAAAAAYQQQQYPAAAAAAPAASANGPAGPTQPWWPQYPSYNNGSA